MELFFRNRKEWRDWLEMNSASADNLWMIFYKKHTRKEGKMTKAGLEAYNEIFKNPHLVYDSQKKSGDPVIPQELLSELEKNKTAFDYFMNFPPSARRIYIEWYQNAKQDKTRISRAQKIIRLSEKNRKPGMM